MLSVDSGYFTQLVLSPFFPPVSSLCPFLFISIRCSLQKNFFWPVSMEELATSSSSLYTRPKLSRRWLKLCTECKMDILIELNARKQITTSKDRFCYNSVFLNNRSRRTKISTLPSTKNKPLFLSTTAVTDSYDTTPTK